MIPSVKIPRKKLNILKYEKATSFYEIRFFKRLGFFQAIERCVTERHQTGKPDISVVSLHGIILGLFSCSQMTLSETSTNHCSLIEAHSYKVARMCGRPTAPSSKL